VDITQTDEYQDALEELQSILSNRGFLTSDDFIEWGTGNAEMDDLLWKHFDRPGERIIAS